LRAASAYLAGRRTPRTPAELSQHNCIGIRRGDDGYGLSRLTSGRGASEKAETVRVHGSLPTNDDEVAVKWALDGLVILMRAEWDTAEYLADGRLAHVLPDYRAPSAEIYAVYLQQLQTTARVKPFFDMVVETPGAR
jgi:DNA-binding transcriptional LysR family regulator